MTGGSNKPVWLIILTAVISLMCNGPTTETGEYRIDNIRIFRDTPAWELAKAVYRQDVWTISRIGAQHQELLNSIDPICGTSLLHWSIGTERYKSTEALLKVGADPNIMALEYGRRFFATPLVLAAFVSWVDNDNKPTVPDSNNVTIRLQTNWAYQHFWFSSFTIRVPG